MLHPELSSKNTIFIPIDINLSFNSIGLINIKIQKTMKCENSKATLIKGQYYIPVFENYKKAQDYSDNGKYDILHIEEKDVI